MLEMNPRLEEARQRALIISEYIKGRADEDVRRVIEEFEDPLDFMDQLDELAIAEEAWEYIAESEMDPKLVFAHPDVLRQHPETSLYYRGVATLSLKRVQALAGQVSRWEDGTWQRRPSEERCLAVAQAYNAVISAIISGVDDWNLEDANRNILATMGISEDGSLRNVVGQEGETAVKERISAWLAARQGIHIEVEGNTTLLGDDGNLRMVFGSEPDISFESLADDTWTIVSTIEIKSGTDPAGALERLGAIQKSFEQTGPRCRNFAVLGIVTTEMRRRLNEMNVARDFSLRDILSNEDSWEEFAREIFHHTLRIID